MLVKNKRPIFTTVMPVKIVYLHLTKYKQTDTIGRPSYLQVVVQNILIEG